MPIATQTLHAAGAAMAFKVRKEPRCALAYIGDGGTSEGAFYEALNLAGARALPVVFVIVNNGWAISVPVAAQTATRTLAQKAVAAGIPACRWTATTCSRCARRSPRRSTGARGGGGPTLIEALTYRLSDHTTADDAGRYRGARGGQAGLGARTVASACAGISTSRAPGAQAHEQALQRRMRARDRRGGQRILGRAKPSTDAMFDHLFAELPRHLREQRDDGAKIRRQSPGNPADIELAKDNHGRGHRDGAWLGNAA